MKKLGFGLMRLPQCADGSIDLEQVKHMVDDFMAAGFTYFDTAYVYGDGASEKAAKTCLVDRYPRESYQIATKLNGWMGCHDEESAKKEFEVSLERLGCGYIDYYLLHAVKEDNLHFYNDWHLWDFIKEKKAQGLIKHIGFSYHDQPELLDQLLNEHPEVDFVQLQLNYADWENPAVSSKRNYEVCVKHHKKVIVMEPIKGGTLATPAPSVADVLKKAEPDMSVASWAIRYVASLENVIVVLSGMSNQEQMDDNISYMRDFVPLTAQEQEVIHQVQDIMASLDQIPCTACHYCTPGCPVHMPIPEIFEAMNRNILFGNKESAIKRYQRVTKETGPEDCIACGQCEAACPQHIAIIEQLKRTQEAFS